MKGTRRGGRLINADQKRKKEKVSEFQEIACLIRKKTLLLRTKLCCANEIGETIRQS